MKMTVDEVLAWIETWRTIIPGELCDRARQSVLLRHEIDPEIAAAVKESLVQHKQALARLGQALEQSMSQPPSTLRHRSTAK